MRASYRLLSSSSSSSTSGISFRRSLLPRFHFEISKNPLRESSSTPKQSTFTVTSILKYQQRNPSAKKKQRIQRELEQSSKQRSITTKSSPTTTLFLSHDTNLGSKAKGRGISRMAGQIAVAKQAAAFAAVDGHFPTTPPSIEAGQPIAYIGIGSGSTVVHVVERIAQLPAERLAGFRFVPTGFQSRQLVASHGLPLADLDSIPPNTRISVCFDGADECDASLNLIKGGGACLLQEKLVAVNAEKFVMVADSRKYSANGLCNTAVWKTGIPVEVVPNSWVYVQSMLQGMGAKQVVLRGGGTAKAGPCVTDNGCFILDCLWDTISAEGDAVQTLAEGIKMITGVVEHGLFYGGSKGRVGRPVIAYLGEDDGTVKVLEEPKV